MRRYSVYNSELDASSCRENTEFTSMVVMAKDATAIERERDELREGMKRLAGMLSTTAAVLERDKHYAAEIVRTAQRLAALHQTNDGSDDDE
jgi:hypothetical protein